MATEGTLDGLFVGADHVVELTVYQDDAATIQDITGWTIVLDIRHSDLGSPALISKTGTVSGVYNSVPATNTQKVSFTITDDDLAASVFPADDKVYRYSIKRTDAGSEQPLRYGDATIVRVTQT